MSHDIEKLMSLYFLDPTALTEEQSQTLSDWIKADPEHTRRFVHTTLLHREIHAQFSASDPIKQGVFHEALSGADTGFFERDFADLLNMEKTAPDAPIREIPAPPQPRSSPRKRPSPQVSPAPASG